MSASEAAQRFAGAVRELRAAGSGQPLRTHARQLGATAAAHGASADDVVEAVLAAAVDWWRATPPAPDGTRVHRDAAALLDELGVVAKIALEAYHAQARTEVRRDEADRVRFVQELLSGRADPARLAQRAQRYGVRIAGAHSVLVVRASGLSEALVTDVDTAIAERFGAGNTLTILHEGNLVCISTGGLRGLPAEVAHLMLDRLGAGAWQVGVGRAHPGVTGIATSLDEARNVLDLAKRLGFSTPVLHAADLLVFPVLLRDREAITDLVENVLGPLRAARGGPLPYLETLGVLFDNQGNYTATARALHLSVRAVTYRLDRIRALTGYHPAEATQRFTLHAAVLGARLLGWPAVQDE
jgi:sugar diacid utilization regulator